MAKRKDTTGFKLSRAARIAYIDRQRFLAEIGFKTYRDYLHSPLWKSIRSKVLSENPKCEFCPAKSTEVHHSSYHPAALRGEAMRYLHAVCRRCHFRGEFSNHGYKRSPMEATRAMVGRPSKAERRLTREALLVERRLDREAIARLEREP